MGNKQRVEHATPVEETASQTAQLPSDSSKPCTLPLPSKFQSSWKIKPAQRENGWHRRDQMCVINHLFYTFSSFAKIWCTDRETRNILKLRRPLAVTMADGASLVSVSTVWPPPEAWTPRLLGICTTSTVPHLSYSYCYMDPQYFIWAVGVPILRENQIIGKAGSETSTRNVTSCMFYAHPQKNGHVGLGCQSFARTCRNVYIF